jgi:glutathione S-transferase
MSGGSFDYLDEKLDDMCNSYHFPTEMLLAMADWLEETKQDQAEAAKELRKAYDQLSKIITQLYETFNGNAPLADIIHAAEWWCSHDTAKEDFEKEWQKYKAKMKTKPSKKQVEADRKARIHLWD